MREVGSSICKRSGLADVFAVCVCLRVLIGGVHAGETAIVIIITMGVERSTQRLQTIPVLVSVVISPAVESSHLLDSGLQLGGNILLQTGHGLAERNGVGQR